MLKKVLECRDTLDEFHENVLKAVIEEYPKFAGNVVLRNKYKTTPIEATLDLPITVSNEVLHATVMFSKEDDRLWVCSCSGKKVCSSKLFILKHSKKSPQFVRINWGAFRTIDLLMDCFLQHYELAHLLHEYKFLL